MTKRFPNQTGQNNSKEECAIEIEVSSPLPPMIALSPARDFVGHSTANAGKERCAADLPYGPVVCPSTPVGVYAVPFGTH
jgi:hypothetical protein